MPQVSKKFQGSKTKKKIFFLILTQFNKIHDTLP